ncbi:MAG: type IV secretion system DNA-binding domain-containing protein [bacterium]|nr:type IV secretion system DNA-binding domain-containing protein [bacterium]
MFEILIYIFKGIVQLLMWTWPIIVLIVGVITFQNFRKSKWVEENLESVVLAVKIPKNSEKGPTSAEMMFASLHGILKPEIEHKKEGSIQEHISFEMVADSKSIMFYVWVPKDLQNFTEGQIYAQYPTAEIATVDDYSRIIDIDNDGVDDCVAGCELKLVKPDYFPIKTFMSFEVDPLAGITGALSKIEDSSEKMWIQILTRPVSDTWRNKGLQYAENLKNGSGPKLFSKSGILHGLLSLPAILMTTIVNAIFPPEDSKNGGGDTKLPHNVETSLAGLEEKANKLGYQVKIRLVYIAKTRELAKQHLRITAGAFKQFNTTLGNGFTPTKIKTGREVLNEYRARLFTDKGFVLNIEEVASLYHLPHASVETPNIVWTSSKKGEPPANLPYVDDPTVDKNDLTVFAETTFRGQLRRFGIKKDDRRRHMYVLGKSGAGKSKLLELLAVDDIERGEGVGIVDPHGELIHDILKKIPDHRIEDVVYINPADKDFPVGFNPMKATPELREGVASGFVSVFKKQFGYSWGPRLEYLMRYAILALTYYPDTTMLDVVKILTDKDFRKKVLTYVEDPVVKTFWLKEFSTYNDKFATEAVAPILNKVGQFTASPTIRNIIGQTKETFDFEDAMNSQKIILVDLSSGKIGEDNSELLGSLMITKMQLAAMARARINPEDRKDFFLYVDEFQNFATEAFAKILSEARKYRLGLILANQYVAQMEETVRDAVFGNIGTLISFRVGATDATYLEKEFSPTFEKDDLIGLDNQHMYLNMLIDGVATNSFSAKSLFVGEGTGDNVEKIIALSREKYAKPREEIEEQIRKWSNVDSLDIDGSIDRQNESKFDENDYVRNAPAKNARPSFGRPDSSRRTEYNKPTTSQNAPYKKETNRTNPSQTQNREATPIKKSVDPEELKKIIQKITQPTEKKTIKEERPTSTGSSSPISGSLKIDPKPSTIAPVNNQRILPTKNNVVAKPNNMVRSDSTTETIKEKLAKAVTESKPEGESDKPEIKITKITGGAEVERVERQEPVVQPKQAQVKPQIQQRQRTQEMPSQTPQQQTRVQPQPVNTTIQPNKTVPAASNTGTVSRFGQANIMTKKFADAEDENVRKITREEFLGLKEILPNEKIIIVDQKEGESAGIKR